MIEHKYNLGDQLKDKVTGFTGIVLGITLYSTGCRHYGIQSQMKATDTKPSGWEWFDENRLVLIKSKVIKFDIYKPTSGNFPNAPEN